MNEYPPSEYIAIAMRGLPAPGPDAPPYTVGIDAGKLWGHYQVTFVAKQNPRKGMRTWFWSMESGKQVSLPTQKYEHFLSGEVLNEQGQWIPVLLLLSPEDAATLLATGGRDLEQNPQVLALLERKVEFADVRGLHLLSVRVD